MDTLTLDRPYRATVQLKKFFGDDQTVDPYETVIQSRWFESDGTPIDDEDRIAELNRRLEEGHNDQD